MMQTVKRAYPQSPLARPVIDPIVRGMWQSKPYRDAVDLQKLIMAASKDADAKDLAGLGKTFATLEMLKLRLRMKPAPKPVSVENPRARGSGASRGGMA